VDELAAQIKDMLIKEEGGQLFREAISDNFGEKIGDEEIDQFLQGRDKFDRAARFAPPSEAGIASFDAQTVGSAALILMPLFWQVMTIVLTKLYEKALEEGINISLELLKDWFKNRKKGKEACLHVEWPDRGAEKVYITRERFGLGKQEGGSQLLPADSR
jgi:hypothetical protein